MKKYKVYFSFFNLFDASQKEIVRLQTLWATITTMILSSTLITVDDRTSLICAIVCGLIDKLISCFFFEEISKP